jgi:tRNA(Ile)-lysidine synthase
LHILVHFSIIIGMKDPLLLTVRKFLEPRIVPGRPVLLGYSGGPDSKALLHLLLDCCRFFPFELHLAHIDHGWREESGREALELQNEAKELGLPFYLQALSPSDFVQGNLEEQGRNLRLQFFSQIYREQGCQALALGHHADDQAEVVLKRVFEGASLFSLGGLEKERSVQDMNLWRPLVPIHKKTVLEWLEKRQLGFFQDPTNHSLLNLRGRMREEILPLLSNAFGKEIAANLCRLGEESQQLKEYFSDLNRPILATVKQEGETYSLDLTPFFPLPAVQLKFLLKQWLGKEQLSLSRQILEDLTSALLDLSLGKRFITNEGKFQAERGHLYFSKLT